MWRRRSVHLHHQFEFHTHSFSLTVSILGESCLVVTRPGGEVSMLRQRQKRERETFSFVAISNLKLKNAELHTEATRRNEEAAKPQNSQSLYSAAHQYPKERRKGKIGVNFPLRFSSWQRTDPFVSLSDESSAAADDVGSVCCKSSR